MDVKETSVMTEASGLIDQQDGGDRISRARPLRQPSQNVALRWAERLRETAVKAPLQSLFVALLLGIWVARRR